MNRCLMDAVIWFLGARGPVPGRDDFGGRPGGRPLETAGYRLIRIAVACIATIALLSLGLWAAFWLAGR